MVCLIACGKSIAYCFITCYYQFICYFFYLYKIYLKEMVINSFKPSDVCLFNDIWWSITFNSEYQIRYYSITSYMCNQYLTKVFNEKISNKLYLKNTFAHLFIVSWHFTNEQHTWHHIVNNLWSKTVMWRLILLTYDATMTRQL